MTAPVQRTTGIRVCVGEYHFKSTSMMIFTYKLATYLSTGLQNALFRGSCRGSRVSGISGWYRVRIWLGLGLVFHCMSPVDMICKYVCVGLSICVSLSAL